MGNVLSPKKEEVKGGEVHDGPNFDFINLHLPSAGGAVAAIAAICFTLLLVWLLVKKCRRHDRAARIKNLRDLRFFRGGGGREDVEMAGFDLGPMSPPAASRPMMFPPPFSHSGYPSPFGGPFGNQMALGWNPPAVMHEPKARRPRRFHSSRIQDVTEEEERKHSADAPDSVAPPENPRAKHEAANSASDRWRPDEYDWDE